MIIARFPNGQEVTYNDATFVMYTTNIIQLYKEEGGQWIASIPYASGATIEAIKACKVENPLEKLTGSNALDFVANNLRSFSDDAFNRNRLALMKRELANFNLTTKRWKQ